MIRVIQISSEIAGTALPGDILRDVTGSSQSGSIWMIALGGGRRSSWGWGLLFPCLSAQGLAEALIE
jgi:hypothetical protein